MKKLKMNPRSKSSGQVIVILIIVVALLVGAWWWLSSNKQEMATEGKQFARDAAQRIVVQRDMNFFNSHLSPQARMNFPQSAQQDFFAEIAKLGAPSGAIDVKGEIEFNSQFFEPHGSFQARINYPARYADLNLIVSHPVGRWQIDQITFLPQQELH
ncbi:MAG: hypothetical protein DMF24_06395 [Verrucomicrobia bacterium]|nr:MAG: hypothetical protein DME90_03440 [Verrucomicrobiota bacterium]PYL61705.1 MAG: hypothetical protein DMF24_06395 [Verrucomicrobiota bacterium]